MNTSIDSKRGRAMSWSLRPQAFAVALLALFFVTEGRAGSSDLLQRAVESSMTEQSDLQRQIRARRLSEPLSADERPSRDERTAIEISVDAGNVGGSGVRPGRRPNSLIVIE